MPITDDLGRQIPAGGDAADLTQILTRYSLSDVGITTVTSRTAANTLLATVNAAALAEGVSRRPVAVWRSDTQALELHPNTGGAGEGWEYLGGRQHAVTLNLAGTVSAGGSPVILDITGITRATPGWTISGNTLIVPATGLYDIVLNANLGTPASTLGRVYGQVSTSNGAVSERLATAANENNIQGSTVAALSAGNAVRFQGYHESGGSRTWTGTALLYMKADPRWTS